ncbi:hypothetical protein F6455_17375 [Proteobacteria bacterium 005FR1]|nr:hypothetical protein [Proteobacteria bacterium 005FR1]
MNRLRVDPWPNLPSKVHSAASPLTVFLSPALLILFVRSSASLLRHLLFSGIAGSLRTERILAGTRVLLPLILLASIANVASGSETAPLDRSGFGKADLPLWSALTPAETALVASAGRLESADPDALLDLYLIASGDVRSQKAISKYRRQIDQWLAANFMIGSIKNEKLRGRRLHEAMHDHFLSKSRLGNGSDSDIDNYHVDQSKLSTLLDNGQYNCISSALLYIVLARKMGLDAEGVIMPSHAFVQLTLGDGEVVEVETTSRTGYDLEHDEEFYSPESGNWFSDRELDMPTFDDYQQREIVSPLRLGLENMWSQHTHPDRMSYADRMRLTEIRAQLQPDDLDAQKNRLFFYTREFSQLNEQQRWPTLLRLYDAIGVWLDGLAEDIAKQRDVDLELKNLLAWVQSGRAVAQLHSEQPSRALQMARRQLGNLNTRIEDAERIRSNLFFVIAHYANEQTEAGRFEQARSVFEGLEFDCLANEMCENAFARLYAAWAETFWDSRQWEEAISVYLSYLKLDESGEPAQTFRANLESAYLNWANTALHDDDWRSASRRLESCTTELSESRRCSDLLRRIQEKRHMGIF